MDPDIDDVRQLIKEVHRMTSEYCKVRKEKKAAQEARLAANPMAKGPGRPRKEILHRIDGHQEFLNTKGVKVLLPCLPRESKCQTRDHVKRIIVAYERLKRASVRVTVKHIRLLGIGAGTFLENKAALPAYITAELAQSARVKSTRTETTEQTHKKVDEQEVDDCFSIEHETKTSDVIHPHPPADIVPGFEGFDDDFVPGVLAYELMRQDPLYNQYSQFDAPIALRRLLENTHFRNAILIVDGVFEAADWIPPHERRAAYECALEWVEEVKRQRMLNGLPVVNMRPIVPSPQTRMEKAKESHRDTVESALLLACLCR